MYIPVASEAPGAGPDAPGASGPCWCNRTLTETGPDDQPVSADLCRAGRSCFDS